MDFAIDFSATSTRALYIPFATSFLAVLILRLLLGPWRGSILATLGICCGFLVTYFLIRGVGLWPPAGTLGLLPYIALLAIMAGTFMDIHEVGDGIVQTLFVALALGIVFWVALEWNEGVIASNGLLLYGILAISGYWAMQRMHEHKDEGLASPVAALSGLTGLAIIAHLYGTRTSLFAMALAAAIAGYMLWNWPRCRYPWGVVGTIVCGGCYIAIASELSIKNPTLALPVGLTLASFITYDLTSRLFAVRPIFQPFIQTLFSAIPIALAAYLTVN